MGKPSLILAALAADALPGLHFVSVQDITNPEEDIVSQLLTTDDGHQVLLRTPKSAAAMTILGLEVRALRVLKNVNFPFRIPALLGETSPSAIYKALAFDYVTGKALNLQRVRLEDPTLTAIGSTLARIHSIPASIAIDAGLPEYDASLKLRERVAEFDRAMETGLINPTLLERWQSALLDVNLFRYQSTVIHGNFTADSILTEGDEVTGINNWSALCVDDPAIDIAALFADCSPEVGNAIILAYEGSIRADRNLKQRANLYYELSFAKHLLWAVETQNEANINDAVGYLNALAHSLAAGELPDLAPTELANSTPEVVTPISQASSFTAPVTIVTEQFEVTEQIEVIDLNEENPEPKN
jgi:aminoglycoside phosphotransferase (APT) family kinase protein